MIVIAGGSLIGSRREGGSSPDKAGTGQHCRMAWVRRARWEGIREEPMFKAPQEGRWLKLDGYGPDSGADSFFMTGGSLPSHMPGLVREAMVKVCGVAMAMSQGQSRVPNPSTGW